MDKFCSKCGNKINEKEEFCSNCGTKLNDEKTTNNNDKKKLSPIVIVAIVFVVIFIIFMIGVFSDKQDNNSNNGSGVTNYDGKTTTTTKKANNKKVYGFNETFIFDDLEITIGSDIKFDVINNRFSDYNGKTVVGVPVTVKNLLEETHGLNSFYYTVYGSVGTRVDTKNAYFDDTLDYAGDLRYNASYTKYTYFLYDGNGTYSMEFDDWSTKVLVEFQVNK